jgi:hypothetical protein
MSQSLKDPKNKFGQAKVTFFLNNRSIAKCISLLMFWHKSRGKIDLYQMRCKSRVSRQSFRKSRIHFIPLFFIEIKKLAQRTGALGTKNWPPPSNRFLIVHNRELECN